MGSRTRESLFNLLRGWFEGTTVIDLFAGVGTLGLEAASRGAAQVVCVERDRLIARLLRQNIETLRCGDRVTVIEADALSESTLAAQPTPVDVVFCDPPFALVTEPAAPVDGAPRHERLTLKDDDEEGDGEDANVRARREDRHGARHDDPLVAAEMDATRAIAAKEDARRRRELARFESMLASLRRLFGDRGFLALRLPEPRRGGAGAIPGFDGPEIHGYGDQQWVHLYAPARPRETGMAP